MFSKKVSLLVLPFVAVVTLQANDPFFNDPFGDDIFKEMYQMQKEMDKIFERMQERMDQRTKLWNYPSRQNLIQTKRMTRNSLFEDKGTYYEYNTQIPESQNNKIDITINDGILHLNATINTVKKTDNPNMKMQQRYMRMIQRSETLPKDADPTSLKSEYQNGLLMLTLQKKKILKHPTLKEKEEEKSTETPKIENVKEKIEGNSTKIKVPHTSTHV